MDLWRFYQDRVELIICPQPKNCPALLGNAISLKRAQIWKGQTWKREERRGHLFNHFNRINPGNIFWGDRFCIQICIDPNAQ